MNRKKAREESFILIYQCKFQSDAGEEILQRFFESQSAGKQEEYIKDIVLGVSCHAAELDQLITKYAKGWDVGRISSVSVALMRLAIYEMMYRDDIPHSVSINEAVDLVKKYEGDEAVSFVNGILGAVEKSIGL